MVLLLNLLLRWTTAFPILLFNSDSPNILSWINPKGLQWSLQWSSVCWIFIFLPHIYLIVNFCNGSSLFSPFVEKEHPPHPSVILTYLPFPPPPSLNTAYLDNAPLDTVFAAENWVCSLETLLLTRPLNLYSCDASLPSRSLRVGHWWAGSLAQWIRNLR